jgi:hypothetical protein
MVAFVCVATSSADTFVVTVANRYCVDTGIGTYPYDAPFVFVPSAVIFTIFTGLLESCKVSSSRRSAITIPFIVTIAHVALQTVASNSKKKNAKKFEAHFED